MRKQLLISTAALLAGIGIASAQEMPGGKQSGGAQMEHGSAAQSRERGQTTGQAPRDQGKQSQHDQGMSQGKQSQGMPNEGMPGQQSKSKQSQTKQSQTKQSQGKQGQAEQRGQGQRDQTTGQGQRDQGQSSAQGQRGQRDQTQGQGQQGQPSSQSETRQGQTPQQGQAQQGQTQQGTQGAGGSVTLNSQQRTRIQQTVLAGRNVPRVNNVNFALSVGTAVPSSVRIVDVPSALIEINPQWRGHQYFVVRDEIIIVDRSRKIVATVPVGSSGGAALHSCGGAASVAEVNLTEEQIRRIQIVLNEKGFSIGRPDGRLGPRTIRALTAFQRRRGLQASGRLDSRTVAALGVSNVSGAQGGAQGAGQSSTTGQGGAGSQRAPAQQNQGARQPSTSGGQGGAAQQGAAQQHAPSQHNEGASKPSTSGQGSSLQTPAQRNQGSSQRPASEQHENAGSK